MATNMRATMNMKTNTNASMDMSMNINLTETAMVYEAGRPGLYIKEGTGAPFNVQARPCAWHLKTKPQSRI